MSNVSHPSHYNTSKYECIDIIEALGWGEGFNRGNSLKYLMRAGAKDPTKEIEDLQKAAWYINREIERLQNGKICGSKYDTMDYLLNNLTQYCCGEKSNG